MALLGLLAVVVALLATPAEAQVTIGCRSGATWQQGKQQVSQYECTLRNEGTVPQDNVTLSCSPALTPSATWNLTPNCTFTGGILYPGQAFRLGYQTSAGPSTITVLSSDPVNQTQVAGPIFPPYVSSDSPPPPATPSGGGPEPPTAGNTPPSSGGVTLNCTNVTSWTSGGKMYEQFNCVLRSSASAPVNNIVLSCTGFAPTAQWNINADCTLPNTTMLYPGQDYVLGYQTTSGPATMTVTSYNTLPQGSSGGTPLGPSPNERRAVAVLTGTSGVEGLVNVSQAGEGPTTVVVRITGLTPGKHGFHVHKFGDLSGGCTSAGPHWNPAGLAHGGPEDAVRHAGDLGNIEAGDDGVATATITDTEIVLSGDNSIVGRSFVVHEKEDDLGKGGSELSSTTGNAGLRLACGVVGLA